MVCGEPFHILQRFEAESMHRFRGRHHPLARHEEIDVILRANGRIRNEGRTLGEAFDGQEFDSGTFETRRQVAVQLPGAAQTFGVIADGEGGALRRQGAQRQGQLRAIAEIQRLLPLAFAERRQQVRARLAQVQRCQNGGGNARQAGALHPGVRHGSMLQKSYRRANCMRRGSPDVKILPKNGPKSGFGPGMPQFGWLNVLKVSARN